MNSTKSISRSFLNSTFPFFLKIDKSGTVRDAGKSILKLYPGIINKTLSDVLIVKRPHDVSTNYQDLEANENRLIFCELLLPTGSCFYKGQVVNLDEERRLCFLCTLFLNDPNDLGKHKITLNDFSISDSSADLLQVLQVNKMVTEDLEKMNSVLKQKEKKYSDIIEHANEIIFTTDLKGQFTYMNEVGVKILELQNIDIQSLSFTDLIINEHVEKIMSIGRKILANEIDSGYIEFQLKDSQKWIGQNITRFSGGAHDGFQGIGRDITEKKRYEEIIIQESRKATEAARSKSRFLANMSHEIRTPLNGIMGLTELLIKGKLNEQQKRYLDAIKASSETLMVVINDILDIAKIESGKMEIRKRPFNLRLSISQMIELMEGKAAEKSLELRSNIDKNIPEMLEGDEARLNQMLFNIVGNAIKFTESGHVQIEAKLEGNREEKVEIKIKISDTGMGIPAEKMESIFRAFQQLDDTENRTQKGTGLGLTITKRLVELMHGKIEVDSEENKGTCFALTIPFAISNSTVEKEKVSSAVSEELDFDQVKILLAEDNPINQMVTIDILKEYNISVDLAENGQEAIDMMQENLYDIVLMDMQMPLMDGYQAMQEIRKDFNNDQVKILALTAHVNEGEIKKCKAHGADHYLSKPFKPEALYKLIVKMLPMEKKLKKRASNKIKHDVSLPKVVNIGKLDAYTGGIVKVKKNIITLLISEIPNSIKEIRGEVEQKNFPRIRALAHRAKPNFQMILDDKFSNPIVEIEQLAETKNNIEQISSALSELEGISNEIVNSLQEELNIL